MNPVWRSQLLTIVRLELKRNFLRVRGLWVYLLAFAPTVIIAFTRSLHTAGAILRKTPISSPAFSNSSLSGWPFSSAAWAFSPACSAEK